MSVRQGDRSQPWIFARGGGKRLARAVLHKMQLGANCERPLEIDNEPLWLDRAKKNISNVAWLAELYENKAKHIVCRVALALLQLMIFFTRAWRAPPAIQDRCGGLGFMSPPRRAIMWHHVDTLDKRTLDLCKTSNLKLIGQAIADKPLPLIAKLVAPEYAANDSEGVSIGKQVSEVSLKNSMLARCIWEVQRGHLPWPHAFGDFTKAWRQYDKDAARYLFAKQSKAPAMSESSP